MAFLESLLSLLAAFGLVCLLWLGAGWLLLPLRCPARVVLEGHGTGEYLEQAVRALLWMRRTGLWRGTVVIRDDGLDAQGRLLASTLSLQDGVRLAAEPTGAGQRAE
ncbi:MAG TPA: hypothetical protein IAC21_06450 [Candidatus Enterenecus merdae]|nr:hypothetical protein [Candidatus Enterenecus merdae]